MSELAEVICSDYAGTEEQTPGLYSRTGFGITVSYWDKYASYAFQVLNIDDGPEYGGVYNLETKEPEFYMPPYTWHDATNTPIWVGKRRKDFPLSAEDKQEIKARTGLDVISIHEVTEKGREKLKDPEVSKWVSPPEIHVEWELFFEELEDLVGTEEDEWEGKEEPEINFYALIWLELTLSERTRLYDLIVFYDELADGLTQKQAIVEGLKLGLKHANAKRIQIPKALLSELELKYGKLEQ